MRSLGGVEAWHGVSCLRRVEHLSGIAAESPSHGGGMHWFGLDLFFPLHSADHPFAWVTRRVPSEELVASRVHKGESSRPHGFFGGG